MIRFSPRRHAAFLMVVFLVSTAQASPLPTRLAPRRAVEPQARGPIEQALAHQPIRFEENVGQTDGRVAFFARGKQGTVFFTPGEAVFAVAGSDGTETGARPSDVLRMRFVGAEPNGRYEAEDALPGRSNYFLGSDPAAWRTDVRSYTRIRCRDLWPGVDVVWYSNDGRLEHDFIVKPGADPSAIRIAFDGASRLEQDVHGNVIVETAHGRTQLNKPLVYQPAGLVRNVAARYTLDEKQLAFDIGAYDRSFPLVVDPVSLFFSSFLGGTGIDSGEDVAVDSAGAAYLIGTTASVNFPTFNAVTGNSVGGNDVFITKVHPNGTSLLFSTYFGGTGEDNGLSIAVDSIGSLHVTGLTQSSDFPSVNAVQPAKAAGTDAFAARLGSSGSQIFFSTFLGGSGEDIGYGVAIDSGGATYITGSTTSTDYPTQAPIQAANGGGASDAFVTKLDFSGTAFVYSTYLGGAGADVGRGIAATQFGDAYVVGDAQTGFPTVAPFQAGGYGGGASDAFVCKIPVGGAMVSYASFLGGSDADQGYAIAVDSTGNAYVTGQTLSSNFPTLNPFGATMADSGNNDAFVTKVNPTGSAMVYSSCLGGTDNDRGRGIAVDAAGAAYLTGDTMSPSFPVLEEFQTTNQGGGDAYVAKVNPGGSALVYASFLGGMSADRGAAVGVDPNEAAYVVGTTGSGDFPVGGGFQGVLSGASDAFLAKIDEGTPCDPPTITLDPQNQTVVSGQPYTLMVDAQFPGAPAYQWYKAKSGDTHAPIMGATSNSYTTSVTVPDTGPSPSFQYFAAAIAACPSGTSVDYSATATVTIVRPVEIIDQPVGQTIDSGQTGSLSVGVLGTDPLTVQWYVGSVPGTGTPIAGANATTYTTAPLSSTTSYWVRITNDVSTVDSAAATITVVPASVRVTNTNDSGPGSLREALLTSNARPGRDYIAFNIAGPGPYTINCLSPLPAIVDPVDIDGRAQPGYAGLPIVELCGTSAGSGADGLHVVSGGTTIRGLVINGFADDGIELEGPSGGNLVQGCYIGTDLSGTVDMGNGGHGIFINASPQNVIGGSRLLGEGNLISGNALNGIEIAGLAASENDVFGCYIGTDATGTVAIGNQNGISLIGAGANRIGTPDDAPRKNQIRGNLGSGVQSTGTGRPGQARGGLGGNEIHENSIYGNGGPGITGQPQTAPIVSTSISSGGTLLIEGSFIAEAGTHYALEYFRNDVTNACPSGGGQGQDFIGSDLYDATATGLVIFTHSFSPTGVQPGETIAVTLTSSSLGTSDFSLCQAVSSACGTDPIAGVPGVADSQTTVVLGSLSRPLAFRDRTRKSLAHAGHLPSLFPPLDATYGREPAWPYRGAGAEATSTSVLSASFAGLADPDDPDVVGDTVIPPDVQGAAGPNHLLEVLNTDMQVQSKTDGAVLQTVWADDFWAALTDGIFGNEDDLISFNPRVQYDPLAGRFIVVAGANPRDEGSALLVAVSQTSDPLGGWNLYRFEADVTDRAWLDFPTLGFNKDWIVVQANMLARPNVPGQLANAFLSSRVYVFDKANLYAGGAGAHTLISSNCIGGTQVPVTTYDADESTEYLVQNFNGNFLGSGLLRIFTVTGPVGSEVLTPGALISTQSTWASSIPASVDLAPQMGTTARLQVNDARMQSATLRNGGLWCAQTVMLPVANPTRSAVQWWQIDPVGPSVVQRGRLDDPTGAVMYAYPSLAVTNAGNAVLGYSRFSADTFASAAFRTRQNGDAPGTLRSEQILKSGESPYHKTEGDARNRWGDYSAAVVDGANDATVWLLNEYAGAPRTGSEGTISTWGTWWGAVDFVSTCSVTCPANVEVQTGPGATTCGAVVTYPNPGVAGECGPIACSPASGSTFAVGVTTVTCTDGGSGSCSFTVTVTDDTAPTITCPSPVTQVLAPGACAATVAMDFSVTDNCPGPISISTTPQPGSTFSVGVTTVTITATDAAGNSTSCQTTVTILDQTAPTVTCAGPVSVFATSDSGAVVAYALPAVADNCAGASLMCVPAPGSTFALGTTTVECQAADASGNSTSCAFPVTVSLPNDSIGVVNSAGAWFLKNTNGAGAANATFFFGLTTDTPVAGDYDDDGRDTVGVYRSSTSQFFLKNANGQGSADLVFQYGVSGFGFVPIVGDWDGDGTATVGLYRPLDGSFLVRNSNSAGDADLIFFFGGPSQGRLPIVGDWDGDGRDGIGLYNPAIGSFELKNVVGNGFSDVVFFFGAGGQGYLPVVGDWDNDGVDGVGLYAPSTGVYFLKNALTTTAVADHVFFYGPTNGNPIAGDWDDLP